MLKDDTTGPTKVYFMEEGDAKAVNSIDHEEETSQDLFHIAGFKTSNRNTRTAALPPQFWGFQKRAG
jgi:hypothetical protein